MKTPGPYVWVGHNRPAFGLSSYFDSHGLLLRTLAIQGFGYDRDWGIGLYKDFSWGDISASATTGSGMPVYLKGNYMTAARVSYGVLSQDNINVGFSLGYGSTLDTMGYKLRDPEPRQMMLAGVDLTILRNNLEHRFDLLAGKWLGNDTLRYVLQVRRKSGPGGTAEDRGPAGILEVRGRKRLSNVSLFLGPRYLKFDGPRRVHLRSQRQGQQRHYATLLL